MIRILIISFIITVLSSEVYAGWFKDKISKNHQENEQNYNSQLENTQLENTQIDSETSSKFPAKGKTVLYNGPGKNPKVTNIRFIIQNGVRPHFSPDGNRIVFDRKNANGYYDLYISDLNGNIINSLTEGNPVFQEGAVDRSKGNGIFDKSGNYVVFIAEEPDHFADGKKYLADPGVGLFSNLWAINIQTNNAWKLTNIPIKRSLLDRQPAIAVVNPRFTPDGKTILWTERYAEGGSNNWGKWRIKAANFYVDNGVPSIKNETVVYTPKKGTYVTLMGFTGKGQLLVAGNLDGQHEYGMDQYIYNTRTGSLKNLTNSPDTWEEDSNVFPDGHIIYMSNQDSKYRFNFNSANWAGQPMERDYYLMGIDGSNKERLTYFNDPSAPEYLGKRVMTVASDIHPDGKTVASTVVVDYGDKIRNVVLKIALITTNFSIH